MIDKRRIVAIVTDVRKRGSMEAASLMPLAISSADLGYWEEDLTTGRKPKPEFPNAGKVSWIRPRNAEIGSVWEFTVRSQPSYDDAPDDPIRDRYMVESDSASECVLVVDLARFEDEHTGRQILTQTGVSIGSDLPKRYWIRTESDLWRQVELAPCESDPGKKFVVPINEDGTTRWTEWAAPNDLFQLACDRRGLRASVKLGLLPPQASPKGPTRLRDWSSDQQVFKRLMGTLRNCLLYTSPSPRDQRGSRMPSSA